MRTRVRGLWAVVIAAALGMGQTGAGRPHAELTPLVESASAHADTTVRVALEVHLAPGLHAQSDRPRDPTLIPTTLVIDPPAGVSVLEIVFPAPTELTLPGYDQPLLVFDHDFIIGVRLAIAKTVAPGVVTIPAWFRYQTCNDKQCFIPTRVQTGWTLTVAPASQAVTTGHPEVFGHIAFGQGHAPAKTATETSARPARLPPTAAGDDGLALLDDFTLLTTTPGGYMNAADFLQFVHDAETGRQVKGLFDGRGPLAILVLVFVGGLALNLTPCVLPMIPINLAIIGAGTQAGRRGRGLLLGAVYGGAMALVYGVLGVVVILTAGTFGTINASPWFNLGIAVLFIVLGLAMFEVIMIDFSRFSSRFRFGDASRGTFLLAFSMGAVAALLAGACVAPVVIQVVLFASNLYAAGTSSALALPFLLGLGMAVPWPLAGAGLAALPKPGAWMVRVRQAFGVFILATAAYYGYEAYGLFANRWVDPATVRASVDAQLKAGWHGSLREGLETAKRDHTLVLIDLWATWCKNCLVMDQTTLVDPAVKSALADYTKIKVQAEDPDRSPAKELMQRVGAVGLPTYIILRPKTSPPPPAGGPD
jgi:thiol:disulfide interchange protein DsbD